MTPEERFWSHIRPGSVPAHRPELGRCWVWTGANLAKGYGRVAIAGETFIVTRLVLARGLGRRLRRRELALHRCDNPPCVRPLHLFIGSAADNTADMLAKGRGRDVTRPESFARGVDNRASKLTEDDVRSLRRALAQGRPVKVCARFFGIDPKTVRAVRDGITWRHVS